MKMTYHQYIQNPMGIHNSVISNREMYRSMYTDKWNKILLRENGKVDYYLYKDKDNFYIHLKIPSEVVNNFYYDVVIKFMPNDKNANLSTTLENYNIKVYSNDPSFVFTYTHAFIKNDLFIDELKSKMVKLAVNKEAKEKNPGNLVGYVKSLYFAFLYIKSRGLFGKVLYTSARPFVLKEFINTITDADQKISDRQREQETVNKRKERNDNRGIVGSNGTKINSEYNRNSTIIGKTKLTGKTSNIKSTKKI